MGRINAQREKDRSPRGELPDLFECRNGCVPTHDQSAPAIDPQRVEVNNGSRDTCWASDDVCTKHRQIKARIRKDDAMKNLQPQPRRAVSRCNLRKPRQQCTSLRMNRSSPSRVPMISSRSPDTESGLSCGRSSRQSRMQEARATTSGCISRPLVDAGINSIRDCTEWDFATGP